ALTPTEVHWHRALAGRRRLPAPALCTDAPTPPRRAVVEVIVGAHCGPSRTARAHEITAGRFSLGSFVSVARVGRGPRSGYLPSRKRIVVASPSWVALTVGRSSRTYTPGVSRPTRSTAC